MNMRKLTLISLMSLLIWSLSSVSADAQSFKEVDMAVGETQTLYLPSSITTLNLKSVTFYSNGISYVQVQSYSNYSVTVKAVKAFSSPIIVRCDYRYFIRSGSYVYEAKGYYDFRITVGGGSSAVKPTKITLPYTIEVIDVGESLQLTPTVTPANAQYTLTWSINDTSVATVSQSGLLTGKSPGNADLKVMTDNGVYTMLRVVVSEVKPSSVSVSPSSLTLTEGESSYLTSTVYPVGADRSVTWTSGNSSVATVNSSGKVVAVKAGTAVITARTSNGKTGSCTVTVKSAVPDLVISDKDGLTGSLPVRANVRYDRTFYEGWNSCCVPFAITQSMLDGFMPGCKIAFLVEFEVVGDQYSFSVDQVTSVGAGVPCLIYAPKDVVCSFRLNDVSLRASPDDSSELQGAYRRTIIGSGHYKLTDDGLSMGVTNSDAAIVAPFRAYVRIK
jgi:uncharacterized protein YjdB